MDSISLSDKFKEVEEIISYLDKEDIDIEDAVCKYAKAKGLLEECRSKIDTAKKEVLKLSSSGEVTPFDEEIPF